MLCYSKTQFLVPILYKFFWLPDDNLMLYFIFSYITFKYHLHSYSIDSLVKINNYLMPYFMCPYKVVMIKNNELK